MWGFTAEQAAAAATVAHLWEALQFPWEWRPQLAHHHCPAAWFPCEVLARGSLWWRGLLS